MPDGTTPVSTGHGETSEPKSDDPYAPSAAALAENPAAVTERPPGYYPGLQRPGYIGVLLIMSLPLDLVMQNVDSSDRGGLIVLGVVMILPVYATTLRLSNVGMSRWLSLLILVPWFGPMFVGVCAALPQSFAKRRRLDLVGYLILIGVGLIWLLWLSQSLLAVI